MANSLRPCQLCGACSWGPIPKNVLTYLSIGMDELHSGKYRQCDGCGSVACVDWLVQVEQMSSGPIPLLPPLGSSTDSRTIVAETLKTLAREPLRTEALLGKLFTSLDLSMFESDFTTETPDEPEDQYVARRMVQFVRAIEYELDHGAIPVGPVSSVGPIGSDEVAISFRNRIPMSFATRETFRIFIEQRLCVPFPKDFRDIAYVVEDGLFETTRPL